MAQAVNNYYSLSVDDGLSQNSVWDVLQDSKGYLWISTSDGINRFDGYNFKHYQSKSNAPNTIAGIGIFKFFEDKQHKLWIAHDHGISYYNSAHDNFVNIYSYEPISTGTTINNFIAEDDRHGLWALISSVGIIHINKKTNKVDKLIPIKELANTSYYFHHSESTNENHFIQITYKHILHFNSKSFEYSIINFDNNQSRCFGLLNDSTIFYFNTNSIIEYNFYKKKFISKRYTSNIKLKSVEYLDCVKYRNLYYLAGTMGINVYNPTNNTMSNSKLSSNNQEADYTYIQTLRVDKKKDFLWICGNGGGLMLYSPSKNKFKHFRTNEKKANMVKSIVATPNRIVFTGLFLNGMIQFDSSGSYKKTKALIESESKLQSVYAINNFSSSKIIYLNAFSICIYDYKLEKMFFRKKIPNQTFAFPTILNVNNSYIFNSNTSLYNIDTLLKIHKIADFTNKTITSFNYINNNYWIGTISDLFIFNIATGKSIIINNNNHIKSICIGSNSMVYVGTTNGLLVFNQLGKLLKTLNTENLLKSNFIYGVLEDDDKCIWISHNKGLSKYNPKNNTINHFDKSDGLQSNEYNTGAYFKGDDGKLYFGGINGINIIDVHAIPKNNIDVKIGLNKISLFDEPYLTDSAYNEVNQLNLMYNQNIISFDFSALDFSNPGKSEYKYQLVGWDPSWIYSGVKHFARYANLPHGNYTLKISAKNSDGLWSTEMKKIQIVISPPFWLSTWFYFIEIITCIFILISTFYYLSYRQKQKLKQKLQLQKQLENERIRISRDLHDNVGAQLSYLITNMEWMADHNDEIGKEEEIKRLYALSESGREAIQTLRHTIWAISQNELSIDDFADRFKQYALKVLEFNKGVSVNFTEKFYCTQMLSPALALNLFRICQESLNNCIKHSQCTNVEIFFKSSSERVFTFEMYDNGIGFNPHTAKKNGHFGLVNMEARAIECKAILTIESAPNKGTKVVLTYNK